MFHFTLCSFVDRDARLFLAPSSGYPSYATVRTHARTNQWRTLESRSRQSL